MMRPSASSMSIQPITGTPAISPATFCSSDTTSISGRRFVEVLAGQRGGLLLDHVRGLVGVELGALGLLLPDLLERLGQGIQLQRVAGEALPEPVFGQLVNHRSAHQGAAPGIRQACAVAEPPLSRCPRIISHSELGVRCSSNDRASRGERG